MAMRERGQAAAEVLIVGALTIMTITIVLLRTWAVIDTKFRVEAAAREAVRAYVEAESGAQADVEARRAALSAMGVARIEDVAGDPGRFYVRRGGFGRCERVEVMLRWKVPAVGAWSVRFGEVTVTGSHTEVVDPFRNQRTGPARCTPRDRSDP